MGGINIGYVTISSRFVLQMCQTLKGRFSAYGNASKIACSIIQLVALPHAIGDATAAQEWDAFHGVCDRIDHIVNEKKIQNRLDNKNIIFIGLYPDISK
ncbi:MAG: hypothetical protein R6V01_07005 [Thermoplasmatota archaeon]